MTDGWHPSMGPSDTVLTYCADCDRFIEGSLAIHDLATHPQGEEAERRRAKQEAQNARNWARRGRPGQMRLHLDEP